MEKNGVSFGAPYDEHLGGPLQVDGINVIKNIEIDKEYATNEKQNGKTVYEKIITFFNTVNVNSMVTIAHGIPNADSVWIDYSNSYIQATNSPNVTYTFPLVLYSSGNIDVVQPYADLDNLYLRSQTGWNNNWKKVIKLKYTKV